jgi:hypothetical protein
MPQQTSDAELTDAQFSVAQVDGELVTAPWMGLHYRIDGP